MGAGFAQDSQSVERLDALCLICINDSAAIAGYYHGMMNSSSIHGHEVIQMMVESGRPYSVTSLRDAIVERFGAEARFHTCSADGLTPEGLIEFLGARGKLMPVEGGFVFGAGTPCGHDDHSH